MTLDMVCKKSVAKQRNECGYRERERSPSATERRQAVAA
jgi:hypothetical protein